MPASLTCGAFLWVEGDLYISAERMLANSDKALQMPPDSAEAHATLSLLADVYEAQGRHAESKAAAQRGLNRVKLILSQRPNSADLLGLGAANAVYLAEYALAEEWAQRAVQLEPDNFTARYNVACAYAVMAKADIAMEHLEYMYSKYRNLGSGSQRYWLSIRS